MPRRFLRRWLLHTERLTQHKSLRWLGPVVDEPNLFHLNRRSVSMAVLVGVFCAFVPIPGQSLLAASIAIALRCNLPIAVVLVFISNPFTVTPLLVMSYRLGQYLLGREPLAVAFEWSWTWLVSQGNAVVAPVVLGSLVAGLVLGVTGYVGVRLWWRWHVQSAWRSRRRQRQYV